MQLLLILLRLLVKYFPGCVQVLEPSHVQRDGSKNSQSPGSQKRVVYLPFLGWLELDAETLANNNSSFHHSEKLDRDDSPPDKNHRRLRN